MAMLWKSLGRRLHQGVQKSYRTVQGLQNTQHVCRMGSAASLQLDVDDKTGVAVMKMCRLPVNSLNLEFLTEMNIALEKLENEKCKGLILTSGVPKIFSAGLDIMEMYKPEEERLHQFWSNLQDVWLRLYGSRMTCIAAINGHSPAGGCLLAMCCDFRIMAPGFTIGLNETKLGIVAPFWFKDTMLNAIGFSETSQALQLGKMFTTEQAEQIKLIERIVPLDNLMSDAHEEINKWLEIPEVAKQLTKDMMRRESIDKLRFKKDEDITAFKSFCTKPHVQKTLEIYMEMLKNKKSKR